MIPEEGIGTMPGCALHSHDGSLASKAIDFIAQEVGEDPNRRIFGACADEPSGKLKFNVGMIDFGGVEQISIDCRIPVTVAKAEIWLRS